MEVSIRSRSNYLELISWMVILGHMMKAVTAFPSQDSTVGINKMYNNWVLKQKQLVLDATARNVEPIRQEKCNQNGGLCFEGDASCCQNLHCALLPAEDLDDFIDEETGGALPGICRPPNGKLEDICDVAPEMCNLVPGKDDQFRMVVKRKYFHTAELYQSRIKLYDGVFGE